MSIYLMGVPFKSFVENQESQESQELKHSSCVSYEYEYTDMHYL